MATTVAGAGHGGTRNNGATALYGGNLPSGSTNATQVLGKHVMGYHSGRHGAVVIESATLGTTKPYSAGTFAYNMEAGKFIGMRYPGWISGVASTLFERGASNNPGHRRSIHRKESDHRLHETGWDYVTGAVTKGANAGDSFDFKNIRGSGNIDDAANPTRAIPGELVLAETHLAKSGPRAVAGMKDYPAKTT
jgi:hypothetical protein